MNGLAIYTAILQGRDVYKEPPKGKFDTFLFTDTPIPTGRARVVPVAEPLVQDAVRSARFIKTLPHLFFHDHEYTLWMDGSMSLKHTDIKSVLKVLRDADVATFRHRCRDCVYDELEACIAFGHDDPELMRRQIEEYRAKGYPAHNGLAETMVVLRRMNPKTAAFGNLWWSHISKGSRRDQLSFNPVAWLTNTRVVYFEGNVEDNPHFQFDRHAISP
jgi:hypothetical protein